MAARTGVVADERDDNAALASLVDDILEILGVGERLAVTEAVFVLRLVENDGSTVGDLSLGNNAADICHVAILVSSLSIEYCSCGTHLSVALR